VEKIVVEFDPHHKSVARAVQALVDGLRDFERSGRRLRSMDYGVHEEEIAGLVAGIERAAHGVSLASLDETAERIRIDGVLHVRVLADVEAQYRTRVGPVGVTRSLYRPVGERNAPTVNTVTLRAGAVEDVWLPRTAAAMGARLARGTSREAADAAEVEGTLPYSHASFEKIGHAVGEKVVERRVEIEETLLAELEIPDHAYSVSGSLDRTAMPMEEPRPRPPGRPRKNAPKRPVQVVHRMAWVGTVTLHDERGEAIETVRYGRMPHEDGDELAETIASDMLGLLRRRPELKVVTLADGAEQMQSLLAEHIDEETFGRVWRLLDFWHVIEKLAAALVVIEKDESARKQQLAQWRRWLLINPNAPAKILALLRQSQREDPDDKDCPVHAAITYFENQAHLMRYPAARAAGLPIGSGNVEATCKSLFTLRMKRPGARWKSKTGGHVIAMRAHLLSGRYRRASQLALSRPRPQIRAA